MKNIFYLIPLYNSEQTILNCLTSINSSRYHLEVIIIDDNSQDNSIQMINGVKNFLPYNIHIIKNKENIGISASLNRGIELALKKNADYLIRLDADDFNEINRTDYQINFMEKNPNIIISSSNAFILKNSKIISPFILRLKSFLENRFRPYSNLLGSIDLHPTFCMRIKPFKDINLRYGTLPKDKLKDINFPFMHSGMEDLLLISVVIYYYGFNSIYRDCKNKLITYRYGNSGLTPSIKKDINSLLYKIFLANNILYLNNIYNRDILKLSKAIANHQLNCKPIYLKLYTLIGFLIIKIKDSNFFYKLFFLPIFLFTIPRIIIQYISK